MDIWIIDTSQIHNDPSKFGKEYLYQVKLYPAERGKLYVIVISGT